MSRWAGPAYSHELTAELDVARYVICAWLLGADFDHAAADAERRGGEVSWGDALAKAYSAATDAATQAAASMMASAANAADAVVGAAAAARNAAASAARMAGNVASFGGRALADAAGITGRAAVDGAVSTVTAPFKAARKLLAPASTPAQTLIEPCPNTWAGKKARLEKRQQMVREGSLSPAPSVRAAAERFAQNNEAVELARLSNDSYAQYPPKSPPTAPPVGWSMMSNDALRAKGVDVQLMNQARAVMYQTPADWPGGPKTVLAFRGTADLEDGIVDHDQAMALETKQYQAAVLLGREVSKSMGSDVLVTGHSLGGGKAQAAGAVGGLGGMMFNSAGLHADTVDGLMPSTTQFVQYRTTGDPLTGTQNSPAVQAAIVGIVGPLAGSFGGGMKIGNAISKTFGGDGLSSDVAGYADKAFKALPRSICNIAENGDVMPPAIGVIHEVQTINNMGEVVSRSNLAGQHSIVSVVNGIEREKEQDMATLQGAH